MGSLGTTELMMILPVLLFIFIAWNLPEIYEKVEKVIRNRKDSTERKRANKEREPSSNHE